MRVANVCLIISQLLVVAMDEPQDSRMALTSMDVVADRMEALRELFPEVFSEGKVDVEKLKQALGEFGDESPERYGLSWAGKADAKRAFQSLSSGTLVPMREESVNFDTTENLIIEGDNLEVLKLLQGSYFGQVKMIYIDPPYNTGGEFIYPDDYREGLEGYLRYSGQVSEEGFRAETNTETSGRFHSKWLSMMYPRLLVARNLLRDDGAIFIACDENEVHNLRLLCDEVFGPECFVAALTILCNPKGRSQDKYFATNHEYVLVYGRDVLPKGTFSVEKDEEQVDAEYPEEDECGRHRLLELRNTHREFGRHNRKNLFYAIYVLADGEISLDAAANGTKVLPIWDDGYEGCWTWERERARRDVDLLVGKQVKGRWKVFRKSYASGADRMLKTILSDKRFRTEEGQKRFNGLFDTKDKLFQSPKSPYLIAQLIATVSSPSDIVVDFFAGSGTTADAVLKLNNEDSGSRRFILVQLPEPTRDTSEARKAGYESVAAICRERVRRVIAELDKVDDGKLDLGGATEQDRGFRAFRLAGSNFKLWNADEAPTDEAGLAGQLRMYADHVLADRAREDILFELLLKARVPLSAGITKVGVGGGSAFDVDDGELLICLEDEVTEEMLREMIERKPRQAVCLDNAFKGNDQLKTNTVLEMKSHDVKFHTV